MKKTALVFPGQGSQTAGMGYQLYEASAAAKEVFKAANSALGFDLTALIFEGSNEDLTRSYNAQPAILTVSMAYLKALEEHHGEITTRVALLAGHSLGEYSALVAAQSLTLDQALRIVRRRGELMQIASNTNPGVMFALIGVDFDDAKLICEKTSSYIANVNSPSQIVIGGTEVAVGNAISIAKEYGLRRAIQLEVSGAFHTNLMLPAQTELSKELDALNINPAKIPVVSNSAAMIIEHPDQIRDELKIQICSAVLWSQSIELMASSGIERFIELGPGAALTGLSKRIAPSIDAINIQDLDSVKELA